MPKVAKIFSGGIMRILSNKKFKDYMLEIQHLKGEVASREHDAKMLKATIDYYDTKVYDVVDKLYAIREDLRHTVSKKVIKAKVQELITMLGGE